MPSLRTTPLPDASQLASVAAGVNAPVPPRSELLPASDVAQTTPAPTKRWLATGPAVMLRIHRSGASPLAAGQ